MFFFWISFFSSINETPFLHVIQQPFLATSNYPLLTLILIQLTYLKMSMSGVHPIATIAVLIEVLIPLYDVINHKASECSW